jgi:hypothetical protein
MKDNNNNTVDSLHDFAKYVVKQARTNLTKGKHNATKDLYKSIKYDIKSTNTTYTLEFYSEEYGVYLDKGVSGKKKKYPNTPFKYTNKMPPPKAFEKWIKAKHLVLRDDKGRFKKGGIKTLSYLIARGVFNNGIKPTLFFTKPFNKAFDRLPDKLANDIAVDAMNDINNTLNS